MNSPAFTYRTGKVTTYPATSPTGGPDRRISTNDASDYVFHRSAYVSDGEFRTEVEVQPFQPDGYRSTIVALVTSVSAGEHNKAGQASVLLSPAEARAIAESLIIAAAEAEAIDEATRQVA